jgi:hypothetical protein
VRPEPAPEERINLAGSDQFGPEGTVVVTNYNVVADEKGIS